MACTASAKEAQVWAGAWFMVVLAVSQEAESEGGRDATVAEVPGCSAGPQAALGTHSGRFEHLDKGSEGHNFLLYGMN